MEEKISQEWNLRGFTCDTWIDGPGQQWEDYEHDVDELFMLIEGKIELEIAGEVSHPSKNEVIHIPAHTKHSIRNIGKTTARGLYGYKMENVNEEDIKNYNRR